MSWEGEHPATVLRGLEQRARRRFGQHFLVDTGVVRRIVRAAEVGENDAVVEVGPGLGVLSRALCEVGASLTAIELDRDLAAHLRTSMPEIRLIEADAASVDWADLLPGTDWKMVANLPYNVGTKVVMDALRTPSVFRSVVVMLQYEVVQRFCATPGTKAYGALTVQARARADARLVMTVERDRFHPPPKVRSAVLRMDLRPTPAFAGQCDGPAFDRAVQAAFSQRRKTVRNALKASYGAEGARRALAMADVDPGWRAEQIDLDGFVRLAASLDATAS